jgi:hypothetical protein
VKRGVTQPCPAGAAERGHSWLFEMDPDSIYGQSAAGILSGTSAEKVLFLGGLGSEVELFEQDAVAAVGGCTSCMQCDPQLASAW